MYTVRPLIESDLLAAAEVERECFAQPWSQEALFSFFHRTDTRLFVAEEQETKKILGYAGMLFAAGEGTVSNVAVSACARSRGIGRALFSEVMKAAQLERLEVMALEVRESNEIAKALYESFGFSCCGKRKRFYQRPTEDALIYTKRLGETS